MSQKPVKRALGRGLDALLDDMAVETPVTQRAPEASPSVEMASIAGGSELLPVDLIAPAPDQPRKRFDDAELEDLANSIRSKGVIQPILVRRSPNSNGMYEIVAGERRWRAAQLAKVHEIPALIRDLDEREAFEIAIIENVQRSDLNAMEEAQGYQQLIDKYDYTQEELATNLGKSRSHIANTLRLANLPREIQELVRVGKLTAGHARAVLSSSDPIALARKIVTKGLSVRDAEAAVKREGAAGGKAKSGGSGPKDSDTLLMEAELRAAIRMPVNIVTKNRESGDVKISYRSLEELDSLFQLLRGERADVLAHG